MRAVLLSFLFISFEFFLFSQEYLVPLPSNTQLHLPATEERNYKMSRSAQAPLSLPFIDDFSNRSYYPNPAKWSDQSVFINSTLPRNPPTIGVATFDGLKADGSPYSLKKKSFGSADTLTSREIDISAFTPSDSLLLSFFLEPKGNGDAPGKRDTFLLEFKVNDSTWQKMFSITSAGMSPDSFRLFFVKLNKAKFFKSDFQFRFRNYATLTGNVDHWHLDYVILNKERSVKNTLLNDVAFRRPARSLLKNYHAMPLHQFVGFEDEELSDSLYADAVNHFNVVKNTTFRYRAVENCTQSLLKSDFFQTINFPPLSDTTLREPLFKDEIKTLTAGLGCDSLAIRMRYVLFNSPPDPATGFNDTIFHVQRFYNYFAYDDGSAERGYLVVGNSPKLALKIQLNVPDSLQAIEVHFPHIDKNLNNELLNLIVWESIDGAAGTDDSIRYRKDLLRPEYVDSINGFYTYVLDSALWMTDSFYVGFQRANADSLEIGFDINSPRKNKLFFYTGGSWRPSLFSGTAMIRPVMGAPLDIVSGEAVPPRFSPITLYPNPVGQRLFIRGEASMQAAYYQIMDVQGRELLRGTLNGNSLDLSMLRPGFYLFRLSNLENRKIFTAKFIIAH